MNAGAAASSGPHARAARRARQRRRVYQSGKGAQPRAAADRDGGRCIGDRCEARGIYRARSRVSGPGRRTRLVLLGDPPSFDEDDSDPHCCVKPLDAVALPSLAATAACRARHGPAASCSAPMASRLRYLVTVYGPGCLPGHRDCLKRHDSLGFDAGRLLCPLVPREPSEGLARPPTAVSDVHAARDRAPGASGSIRPRRPSGVAYPCPRGCIPRRNSAILAYRAAAHWHLGVGIHKLWRRAHAGLPPAAGLPVCRDGSRPRRHRAAPTWPLR